METPDQPNNNFPSLASLFQESWQTFTQSILSLFLLNILALVVYFGLAVIAFLILIISGAGSFLLKNGLQNLNLGLSTLNSSTIITIVVIAAFFWLIYLVVGSAFQIASILLVDTSGKEPLRAALKKSFGLIIPLFLVNLLVSFFSFGALFVFMLPFLLVSFLLVFVQFEVTLNNQKGLAAVKRSVLIVSENFGAILIRLIILILIYIAIVAIIPGLLGKIGPQTQIIVGITSFFINLLLGWYMLSFLITLYKQARVGLAKNEVKSIAWIWTIAILGWVIAAVIFFLGYKAISSGILNEILKRAEINIPGASIERSVDEMKLETKTHYERSQELFKQIQQLQQDPNKTDAQKIAETKKLNDENIAEIKKALEIEPNNHKLWYDLGSAYTWVSSAGTLENSLTAYQKAEELDPNNTTYINGVGDILIQMGKYEEAILQFQKTLRQTDQSGYANLSLARAYRGLKIYDSAKQHYQKAIEIFTSENKDGTYDLSILQARKELASLPKQ